MNENNATSTKSLFSQHLTSLRISEEYEYLAKIYEKLHVKDLRSGEALLYALQHASSSSDADKFRDETKAKKKLASGSKVCIIGAGMAGLYIAMILDALEIENLEYEILEGDDRIGGRVYTHHFSKKKHDYYDVGAMRFPDIKIMEKTFKLFKHLGEEEVPLVRYWLTSPKDNEPENNQPSRYNDRTLIGSAEENKDHFQVSDSYGGRILRELVDKPEKYVTEAFEPFKARLRANWTRGFQALMKYDEFSVRGFMMSHGITPLDDYYSIQWLETLTDGSGLYDQSFSEGVIDSMDFDYYTNYIDKGKKVKWWCVDGGAGLVPEAMNRNLTKSLKKEDLGKRVTKIAFDRKVTDSPMQVTVSGEAEARKYMTVFATPTLACLQRMDLTGLELLYEQKDALRSLHYDSASKVAMKFSKPWWIELGIEGGLGKTDMPLRTCVYPSYNLHDSKKDSAVLLCSYSWSQDAARIGSLMHGNWKEETELKELLLDNLTHLHLKHFQQTKKHAGWTFKKLYDHLSALYKEHHAFAWHNHEFSSGAYAKFGPGQFSNLYPALTCPTADGRFHFAGEAASAHHGWIVGALDSAHQTVINFLRRFNLTEAENKLKEIDWLQPEPDEITKEAAVMKVVLGLMKPGDRLKVRAAVEKEKGETRSQEQREEAIEAVEKRQAELWSSTST